MVRKLVIAVALAAGLSGVQSPAWADLKFKNATSENVWVAFAYPVGDDWWAEGWWEIKPGGTVVVKSGKLQNRYYCYHAYTSKGTYWEGDYQLWVNPTKRFTIKNVQESDKLKGAKQIGFRRIDTGKTAENFTLILEPATTGGRPAGGRVIID